MSREKGKMRAMGQTQAETLTSGEAAKYLGVHQHTLRRYMDAKLLRPIRNPLTGHFTFRVADLDALKKRAERHGPPLMRLKAKGN